MTMYVIEDDDGFVLDRVYLEFTSDINRAMVFDEPIAPAEYAKHYGGHVVPLVEKPKLVVVSEDMASWLSDAKEMRMPIEFLARCKVPDSDQEDMLRAYVNGWEVEKPKLWNIKVPQKWIGDDKHYWNKEQDGALTWAYLINKDYMIPSQQFTESDIEHYGLQDCERVEVCANNARTTGEVND